MGLYRASSGRYTSVPTSMAHQVKTCLSFARLTRKFHPVCIAAAASTSNSALRGMWAPDYNQPSFTADSRPARLCLYHASQFDAYPILAEFCLPHCDIHPVQEDSWVAIQQKSSKCGKPTCSTMKLR